MKFVSRPVAVAAALILSAVSGTAAAQTQVDSADVRFMQGMIGHHGQALEMTRLVPTHTANPQLHLLARRIDVSQQDEIATMRSWLRDRGQPVPAAGQGMMAMQHDMGAMRHDSTSMLHGMAGMQHAMMPGMLTAAEMAQLQAARGDAFDRLFLQYMIRHHQGALTMVAQLLATPGAAQDPQTFSFASDVDADQRAEIARMEGMLAPSAAPRP
jgi:uncharacterized protein (DUF305 family)